MYVYMTLLPYLRQENLHLSNTLTLMVHFGMRDLLVKIFTSSLALRSTRGSGCLRHFRNGVATLLKM